MHFPIKSEELPSRTHGLATGARDSARAQSLIVAQNTDSNEPQQRSGVNRRRRDWTGPVWTGALVLFLASCQPASDHSRGVELVLSSEEPTPSMTFELRFDEPVANPSQVGESTTNSPLVITPPIPGTFTWLSVRSGTFSPAQPLSLASRYLLTLQPRLAAPAGKTVKASLHRIVTTPPFGLKGCLPRQSDMNATSDPLVTLVLNADIRAEDARPFLEFRDTTGRRIPADVRQGTEAEAPSRYQFAGNPTLWTWEEEFARSRARPPRHSWEEDESGSPTNEVVNLLFATPRQPLPLGSGWRLVVERGLPATDRRLRLPKRLEVPIGDVTPFTIAAINPHHVIGSEASFQVSFSKPPSPTLTNQYLHWLAIEPKPTNMAIEIQGRAMTLRGGFTGNTDYRLEFRAGLPSTEPAHWAEAKGQIRTEREMEPFRLTETTAFTVTMPRVPPRLYFPAFSQDQLAGGGRKFPLVSINVPQVRLRAKLLLAPTAIHALRGYASYFRSWRERQGKNGWEEPYRAVNYNLMPGRTVFTEELIATGQPDAAERFELDWNRMLGSRKTGIVFLDAERVTESNDESPPLGTQALIQLTDLGLVWKQAHHGVEVFVFSQSTGEPVPGAATQLFGNENELLGAAVSDSHGLAHLSADANAVWLAVQLDDDVHILPLDQNQVNTWAFHLPFSADDEPEHTQQPQRVMLFSDRGVYRPGEWLHLKALTRSWNDAGLAIPLGLTGAVACIDARDRQFFQTNVQFSSFGAWSLDLPLPVGSRGRYEARLRIGQHDYDHSFLVQDFQPSAFEIMLGAKAEYAADEKVEIPLSARYFFGKSLGRAQVKWALEAEDAELKPPGFEDYTFARTEVGFGHRRSPSSLALTGEGLLPANSNLVIAPDLPINPVAPRPRSASLLVELTDLNQQTLSRRVEFLRHSSEFYLGLCSGGGVMPAGKELTVEAVALGADGQPWPTAVHARVLLQRVEWHSVRIQGAGRTVRYRNELVLTNVLDQTCEVRPVLLPARVGDKLKGQPLPGIAPREAGQYLLELTARDQAGREVAASLSFEVSAPATLSRDYRDDVQMALKPDRTLYSPGETAELLVEAPFSGTALVTVEREQVLRSFITKLEGNAPSIQVPLEAGDVPNVFVAVTLLRGADFCPRQIKEPDYRVGYCSLVVTDPQSRLTVTVTPGATNYLPAQQVDLAVDVRDCHGLSVSNAELTLYAVDEGVLTLTDYDLPDPLKFFYAPRTLAVRSHVSLPNLLSEDPADLHFGNKGYLGGGGGRDHLRKNFLACALWNSQVTTDQDGKARARFIAPDGLTRYRVLAVAHAGARQFGSGQSAFRISKPLVVEPALPRFANITDRILARAVVLNQTAKAGEVLATLELDDKAKTKVDEPSRVLAQRIQIPANGSAVAEFPVELTETGVAKWIWKARFVDSEAGFTDSVQSTLDVGHVAPLLREILLARVDSPETNLLAGANPELLGGLGTVTVSLSNTRLNELGEAVSQLLHYPYGCVEQTGSSLLPWIVLRDIPSLQPWLRRGTNEIDAVINSGVRRLFSMQTESGGLGYWPGARQPMLWASAYGGLVLALAQRSGAPVPVEDFERVLRYLSSEMRSLDDEYPGDYTLALYALAVARCPEPAYHERLYARRAKLSSEDRALLALAIAESHGPKEMIGELLSVGPATSPIDEERFGCVAREQAIRLLAWVHYRPEDTAVDRLVGDLMRAQTQAHWGTTQGDAWAMLALTEYAHQVEGKPEAVSGQLRCGQEMVPFLLESGANVWTKSFAFTNSFGLTLAKESSRRLFATTFIEARPSAAKQPRQDRGFSLQRRYERLDDENRPLPLPDAALGQTPLRVGDRVLVTLLLTAHNAAHYVAVDDPLPSILEAVNPEFKTQETRGAQPLQNFSAEDGGYWESDFHELRQDRFLSFANWVGPGNYTLRYVARVRAAGSVSAPSAKVEEMYHPERYGLSETQTISSEPLE